MKNDQTPSSQSFAAPCSPIWFVLRWHWATLIWAVLVLVGIVWMVIGLVQNKPGYDIAFPAVVIGVIVVRVENYLDARRREVSEKIDLVSQPLNAWSISKENALGQSPTAEHASTITNQTPN